METHRPTNIMILVRRDMDIDNLAPVAWRLAVGKVGRIRIMSMDPEADITRDPRLSYLADRYGVGLGVLFNAFLPTWRHRMASALSVFRRFSGLHIVLRKLFIRRAPADLYDEKWCIGLLRKGGITHIVMDWAKMTTVPCGALTRAGRKLGIPSIALPHGVDTWNNAEYYVEPLRRAGFFRHFDHIVTPNHIRRHFLVGGGYPAERIGVLGSARFAPAWEAVLDEIVAPEMPALPPSANINLIWFDKPNALVPPAEITTLLNRIAALPFVTLAVKPKPQTAPSYNPAELAATIFDGSNQSSFALCRWATVFAGTPSGIMLEAFVQQKELILTRGLDSLGSCAPYDEPPVCWLADDGDEIVAALESINSGNSDRPYRTDDVNAFIERFLFPNGRAEDVLDDYASYILSCRGTFPPQGANCTVHG